MQYRKLSALKKLEGNPRIIRDKQFKNLVASIRDNPKFFEARPLILSDRTGELVIIAGNQRYEAAKAAGLKEAPTYLMQGLAEEKEREITIRDNTNQGDWDMDLLSSVWADLPLVDWGVRLPEDWLAATSPAGEPADAEPQIDRAEELNKTWGVKPGDLWQIGEHRLLCGDSTKKEDVGRVMGGEKAVLFATDPPYGVAYNDETGSGKGGKIINDENDGPKLQKFLESCFTAWLPTLNKNAAWYLWHAQLTQGFFAAAAAAAGLLIHRQIIWVKPSLIMGHGDYHWRHELCFYGWQQGNRPPFYGDRNQDTVWNIGRESDGIHPTQKPIAIWDAPLHNHTRAGEVCAEPFAGSGSQFVACQNLSRKCRGIEISEAYCSVILQRMQDAFPGIEIRRIEP